MIIGLKEARNLGKSRYFTGVSCINGHIAERQVCGRHCVVCQKKQKLKNYAKSLKTKASQAARARRWYEKNKRKSFEAHYKWAEKNRAKVNASEARRRTKLLNCTPSWADKSKIERFYIRAQNMSKATGEPYHVDHIIPLQGENVCGLHVENNLQVIPRFDNQSKSNRYEIAA